jgi:iron(II)-dependent oxidoreductase
MPVAGPSAPTRRVLAELLAEARARTILLVTPLSHEAMTECPDPAVGSVLAELQRILGFEIRILLGGDGAASRESYDEWFDAMMDVRQRVLEQMDQAASGSDLGALEERYRLVVEHEYRRGEAILEILQLRGEPYPLPQMRPLPEARRLADAGFMVRFPGGRVEIGASARMSPWPEDRPVRQVELAPFWIEVLPVTNGDYLTFMAAGGYRNRELWSDAGWRWLETSQVRAPRHWTSLNDLWLTSWLGIDAPVDPAGPVSQVSFYEAEAFARFVRKRLPTELEWEAAAGWDPETGRARPYPWGSMAPTPHVANLDQVALGPAPVGGFPGNLSPVGCYGMMGDLWEWTSSDFLPYPGAENQTSVPLVPAFDQGCKVLRGGSWATRPGAIRVSVRRPASPEARHLFTGFRCARDG